MEIQSFEETNKGIIRAGGKPEYDPELMTIKFNRYISDSDNGEIMKLYQSRGKTILLLAPTGTGKTYTVAKTNKEYSSLKDDNEELVQIIVTPNRIQNLQNQESYGLKAVVGGIEIDYPLLTNENGISAVADKIGDLYERIPNNAHIVLVIDEAHDILVQSIDYRCETVKRLTEIAEKVKSRNGTVIYMTATPEPLAIFEFDKIVRCEPFVPNPMCDSISTIKYNEVKNIDAIVAIVNEQIRNGKRPLIHCNSKSLMDKIKGRLEFNCNYNVLKVTSADKKTRQGYDIEREEVAYFYENEIFGSVIENSALPGYKNNDISKEVDCWIVTSMINVGTNIKGVIDLNGDIIEDHSVLPMYVCQDRKHMDTNMMEQFFARLRYKVPEYMVLLRQRNDKKEKVSPYKNLLEAQNYEKKRLQEELRRFDAALNFLTSTFPDWDSSSLEKVMVQMLQAKSAHGESDDFNRAIAYNTESRSLSVDYTVAWKHCYDRYQRQYYDYLEYLKERLESDLDVQVKDRNLDPALLEDNPSLDDAPLNTKIENVINTWVVDETLVDKEDIKLLEGLEEFKSFMTAVKAGADKAVAADHALHDKKQKLRKYVNKTIRDNVIKRFDKKYYDQIERAFNNKLIDKGTVPEQVRKDIDMIVASDYAPCIRNGIDQKLEMDCIIRNIAKRETVHDVIRWLDEREVRNRNQQYTDHLDGKVQVLNLFAGVSAMEQLFVLKTIYQRNTSGNTVQKSITPKVLERLCDAINQWRILEKVRMREYTTAEVRTIIERTFYLRIVEDSKNKAKKNQTLVIRDLKLPVKAE